MVTIQTVPNKNSPTKTSPNSSYTTILRTKTLPNSSTTTEKIIVLIEETPTEPTFSASPAPESFDQTIKWLTPANKIIITVALSGLLICIITLLGFQIKSLRAKKRSEREKEGITSPKTPKTPETPEGLRERRRIREEISRDLREID